MGKIYKKAYEENCALGFGTRQSRWQVWEQVYELPKFMPPEDKGISPHGLTEHNDWGYYLMDTLIIHPYKLWDCDKVSELHNNRELKLPNGDGIKCYQKMIITIHIMVGVRWRD